MGGLNTFDFGAFKSLTYRHSAHKIPSFFSEERQGAAVEQNAGDMLAAVELHRADRHYGPREYEAAIDSSVQWYQPEYWAYRERRLQKQEKKQLSFYRQELER